MLSEAPRSLAVAARVPEREALARRFGLVSLDMLEGNLSLVREGETVTLTGTLRARATQSCVASGRPVPAVIDEPIALRFCPAPVDTAPDEEVDLDEGEMEVIFHDGAVIDAGEAVAQSLALALDPYPRAPDAEAALKEAGVKEETEAGPFAALAALKDKGLPRE
jgi:uncharacterized metal-binding protein YceD (DUF177 family)